MEISPFIIHASNIHGDGLFAARDIKKREMFLLDVVGSGFGGMNHSDTYNAKLKVIRAKTYVIALRDINEGEEITVDYKYRNWV